MVDRDPALAHHLLEITIAHPIAAIPPDRPEHYLTLKVMPLEVRHGPLPSLALHPSRRRTVGFATEPLVAQVPRFQGRDRSSSFLAFARRTESAWACLRPCPASRPRGGRAARARGSLRRTLGGATAIAVAVPLSFAFARRLSGVGANRKLGRCREVRAKQPPLDRRMTRVRSRVETVNNH